MFFRVVHWRLRSISNIWPQRGLKGWSSGFCCRIANQQGFADLKSKWCAFCCRFLFFSCINFCFSLSFFWACVTFWFATTTSMIVKKKMNTGAVTHPFILSSYAVWTIFLSFWEMTQKLRIFVSFFHQLFYASIRLPNLIFFYYDKNLVFLPQMNFVRFIPYTGCFSLFQLVIFEAWLWPKCFSCFSSLSIQIHQWILLLFG